MIHINAYNTLPVFLTFAILLGEPEKVLMKQNIRILDEKSDPPCYMILMPIYFVIVFII